MNSNEHEVMKFISSCVPLPQLLPVPPPLPLLLLTTSTTTNSDNDNDSWFLFCNLLGSRASMFTFKSSSVEEETPEKPEDGITDKEMEDLASILAEKILQVKLLLLQ